MATGQFPQVRMTKDQVAASLRKQERTVDNSLRSTSDESRVPLRRLTWQRLGRLGR